MDYPDMEAVIDGDRVITYRQLKEYSENFAEHLHRMGFQKGHHIAIMLPNSIEYVISYYAIQRIRGGSGSSQSVVSAE